MKRKGRIFKISESVCREILCETKGINLEEVVPEAKRIRDKILSEISKVHIKRHDVLRIPYKEITYDDKLFDEPYSYVIKSFYFDSYNYARNSSKYNQYILNGIDKKDKKYYVTLKYIDDEFISGEFANTIQHETQHYYETELSGSEYGSKSYYIIAKSLMNGEDMTSNEEYSFKYMFGVLLYLGFKEEREGFANGLYAFLMENKNELKWNNIDYYIKYDESSKFKKILNMLQDRFIKKDFSEKEKMWLLDIQNTTGMTMHKLDVKLEYVIKDFNRRLNNVKKLVCDKLKLYSGVHIRESNERDYDRAWMEFKLKKLIRNGMEM